MRISDWSSDVCSSDLQLLLRRGGAHFDQAPRAEDEFLDRGADPPHRIGREAEAAFGIELLHALHQSDIAFADQLADRQAIAAVTHCDQIGRASGRERVWTSV